MDGDPETPCGPNVMILCHRFRAVHAPHDVEPLVKHGLELDHRSEVPARAHRANQTAHFIARSGTGSRPDQGIAAGASAITSISASFGKSPARCLPDHPPCPA